MNQLIVHLEKNIFSSLEPIRPGIQIINTSDKVLKITKAKLDWEDFAYSSSCAAHLISEDGKDLASIYKRLPGYFETIKPIVVLAKNEEWFYFPLNIYFPKLEIGNYKFWLELEDEEENILKSNTISFNIVLPEFSVADNNINITISMLNNEIVNSENLKIDVKIINHYPEGLTFLKPNFDSFYGWTNPTYLFVVREKASGRVLPLALRSGSMETPVFDESSILLIGHGEQKNLSITLPTYPKLSQPGEYTIQLYYLVRNNQIGKSGTILDAEMNWKKNVFVGLIESNTINLKVIKK